MKYVVQDVNGKKSIIDVLTSMPILPEGFTVIGSAEEFLNEASEVQNDTLADQAKATAKKFLADSDWQVMRHRDQVDAGLPTSLTTQEFADLLTARQAARDSI